MRFWRKQKSETLGDDGVPVVLHLMIPYHHDIEPTSTEGTELVLLVLAGLADGAVGSEQAPPDLVRVLLRTWVEPGSVVLNGLLQSGMDEVVLVVGTVLPDVEFPRVGGEVALLMVFLGKPVKQEPEEILCFVGGASTYKSKTRGPVSLHQCPTELCSRFWMLEEVFHTVLRPEALSLSLLYLGHLTHRINPVARTHRLHPLLLDRGTLKNVCHTKPGKVRLPPTTEEVVSLKVMLPAVSFSRGLQHPLDRAMLATTTNTLFNLVFEGSEHCFGFHSTSASVAKPLVAPRVLNREEFTSGFSEEPLDFTQRPTSTTYHTPPSLTPVAI